MSQCDPEPCCQPVECDPTDSCCPPSDCQKETRLCKDDKECDERLSYVSSTCDGCPSDSEGPGSETDIEPVLIAYPERKPEPKLEPTSEPGSPADESVESFKNGTPRGGSVSDLLPDVPPTSPLTIPSILRTPLPKTSPETEATNEPYFDIIYRRLRYIFKPSGNQFVSLQLPTRHLYDTSLDQLVGHTLLYGTLKSNALAEAEFRLTDDLFDVAKFVSGPNGKSLSQVYGKILDNLVPNPKIDPASAVPSPRERIRGYLLGDSGSEFDEVRRGTVHAADMPQPSIQTSSNLQSPTNPQIPIAPDFRDTASEVDLPLTNFNVPVYMPIPNPLSVPRVGQQLSNVVPYRMTHLEHSLGPVDAYNQQRAWWEHERESNLRMAFEIQTPVHLSLTVRSLSHVGSIHGNILSTKYADTPPCGHAHTARDLLGHLDIRTTSGILYAAKDTFRESKYSLVYELKSVRSVTMQPADWYETSRSSYAPEDLNYDIDALQALMIQKWSEMDSLSGRLAALIVPKDGDLQKIEAEVETIIMERDELQRQIHSQHSASTIASSMIQELKLTNQTSTSKSRLESQLTDASNVIIHSTRDSDSTTAEQLRALQEVNRRILAATRLLAIKRASTALARSSRNNLQQRAQLEQQIAELHFQIERIESHLKFAQLAAARQLQDVKRSITDIHIPFVDDLRWTAINFSTEVSNTVWQDMPSHPADAGLWYGLRSNQASPVSAENVKVDVSFRVALIKVDRSEWMRTEFMECSNQFLRLSDNLRWSESSTGARNPEEIIEQLLDGEYDSKESMLPALPVGYVIAKDILIKIPTSGQQGITKDALHKQASISDGVLCFRFSPSAGATHVHEFSDGVVMKIPGPQILGYMMQLTPIDETELYNPDTASLDTY